MAADLKRKLIALLDRIFPEYESLFESVFSKASIAVLSKYSTPQKAKNAHLGKLTDILMESSNGTYRYAVSTQKMRLNLADRLQTILRESIVSVDCAQNLVLIKTMAGLGPAAGAAFDGMDISAKVGTVAGDDTVLIVMRENESAAELCSEIEDMQRQRQTK